MPTSTRQTTRKVSNMSDSSVEIETLFRRAQATPSDICEHVQRMRKLAERCDHITEMGVRTGVSTTAWIAARPKTLICYDIQRCAEVELLMRAAKAAGVNFVFRIENVLHATIEKTDLLFIDTLHTYDQLRRELALHAAKARKYIVLHDTETFGQNGEIPGTRGLWPAVEEFLADNPPWILSERRINNNGLTILKRR